MNITPVIGIAMISLNKARQIARRYIDAIGPNNVLLEDSIVEQPYGWYFAWRSDNATYKKEGVDITTYVVDALFSCPPVIVERDTGTPYMLPKAYMAEVALFESLKRAYNAGFRYRLSDLVIHDVYNLQNTVDFLYELHIADARSDTEVWQPPAYYTREGLRERLKTIPCAFSGYNFFWSYPIFEKYDRIDCCVYSLKPHQAE